MRHLKKVFVIILTFCAVFSSYIVTEAYDIPDVGISSITFPEGYKVCTRTECDSALQASIKKQGYTHSQWVQKVMIPDGVYIFAADSKGNTITVSASEYIDKQSDEEGIKQHRLIHDYNLASASSDKESVLVSYRDSIVDSGVAKRNIFRITWLDKPNELTTPYIMSSYFIDGLYRSEYVTVYNGYMVRLSYASKSEITEETHSALKEMVINMVYEYEVDYSQAKQVLRQNERLKYQKDEKADSANVTVTQSLSMAFLIIVVVFSIYETTNKSRVQNKSRRKSKEGKY